MKKNLLAVMIIMALVLAGCGKDTSPAKSNTESSVKAEATISESLESTEKAEANKDEEIPDGEIAGNKDVLNLKEYEYVFEDRDIDKDGGIEIHYESFSPSDIVSYYLKESVDLYIDNGKCIGYTKPDVEISVISENEDWYLINVDGNDRYAKIDDVKAVGFPGSRKEYLDSQQETARETEPAGTVTQTNETSQFVASDTESSVSETPKQDAVAEVPAPTQSNKYTPEEAIAVYRSAMEGGGIAWNPNLKGVTSWGTGWIYLEKGQPEWCASTDLESFAMGDSGGNPWTEYYLEVTSSDESAVYITAWHN